MNTEHAHGLAPFLRYLGDFPSPVNVARAAARGPLAPLGVRSLMIMVARGDVDLISVGAYGTTPAGDHRYRTVSLSIPMPIVTAYQENRTVIVDTHDMVADTPALAIDRHIWDPFLDRVGRRDAVCVPITSGGLPVGAMALLCTPRTSWRPADLAILDGVGAAMGMWATHPRSGVTAALAQGAAEPDGDVLGLTDRQIAILRLAEHGASNTVIAAELGYSNSTVKQEMQRVLRTLRADDRQSAAALARGLGLLG